ncbi:tRNA-guanine transglycosylase, partial [Staphylococcus epidermidis]|uniref:tRNA-guanine transglycosylase n=1 Tax=Staphylococcus epidermidis TaxID=1282 RepID=UPI00119F9EF1
HFSLQPPNDIINHPPPLHKFINSHPPILTHSPPFQLFTLTNFPKISQEPLQFTHHTNPSKLFFTPHNSIQIQNHLPSHIIIPF